MKQRSIAMLKAITLLLLFIFAGCSEDEGIYLPSATHHKEWISGPEQLIGFSLKADKIPQIDLGRLHSHGLSKVEPKKSNTVTISVGRKSRKLPKFSTVLAL